MRLIDEDELMRCLTTIERLARSDAQKALLGRVFYIVDKQPIVDAASVVHGRWLDIVKTDARLRECSVCHDWQVHSEAYIPNYCPDCGAKMDGDGDAAT